jgi:hypothetical protein
VKKQLPKINMLSVGCMTALLICGMICFCGCSMSKDIALMAKPEGPPSYAEISASYCQTNLKSSTAADVLSTIHLVPFETLSQSKSVIATVGTKKKDYKTWLKMAAFDEEQLTVTRKYFFIEDERPKNPFKSPWEYTRLDCQMIIDAKVLEKPFADENAKRIEIVKFVQKKMKDDLQQVRADNKTIDVCGMMMTNPLFIVLNKLEASPSEAKKFTDIDGLGFELLSQGKGKMALSITGDIVTVRILCGSNLKKYNDPVCGAQEDTEGKK